jgi:acyl-CoA synthetase (AMP-forming)/AMP-acid ligase II
MTSTGLHDVVNPEERAQRYRDHGWWTAETLASRVRSHATSAPDSVAVVDQLGKRSRTYGDLARDAAALAQRLADVGVGVGKIVSLQLPNRYEAVVCAVAIQSLGGVINPLLPDYRARELTHVFRTARPVVAITPDTHRGWDYVAMLGEVRMQSGVSFVHVVDGVGGDLSLPDILRHPGEAELPAVASEISELIFTSGTEANPKAIMHTERNTNLAVRTLFADLGVAPSQVVWMPSPVGHSTGFNYGLRAALHDGRTLVLQDRWNAVDAVALVRRFQCSYTLAATTFLRDLVEECERTSISLPELTHFGCGGAPVPPALVQRAEAVGITVLRLYGSTEVLCASWNRPQDPLDKRMHTDGRALSHTEIEIRDDNGVALPAGTAGELCIRGPQSSVGFFDDQERTAATYLPDGWIRSGDLAELDDEGHITIVGRKKEILIRGGVNIAPREIEDMLTTFPEVVRAAVIGVPNDRLGELACAVLVLRPSTSLDLATVVARLREAGLATYKLPQLLRIVDDFPMTPSGKVQKHEIVRRLAVQGGLEDAEVTQR